ncbi:Two-component response regulator [Indibacter alkaliphilus LW1]|uniref:Two-component response regulator n=1 Tax=Indibacter alkaliphilus (strain CCUG 57479 / KCTC 22604 / LW1) TaxID=1189612 RepID=S2D0E4_INDAL|nr:response regulator transcription factor [Indibacter alkaliphilus]EOZ92842.1 Two-component response regulator [Indibacter alkaliphilus LW1]
MNFHKRIVIIEDDAELRGCYRLIIGSVDRYHFVNAYENCEEAFPHLHKDKPDIILMDINLFSGISGIEGVKYIKSKYPHIEVVMISVHDDAEMVFEALRAGASGYITKSSNYLELIQSLDELVKGGAPMSSKIARLVISNFHSNPNSPLSEREKDVLKLISEGKSYTQIADQLFISKETSKTHIKNIYSKLEVNSKSEAIEMAKSKKYI